MPINNKRIERERERRLNRRQPPESGTHPTNQTKARPADGPLFQVEQEPQREAPDKRQWYEPSPEAMAQKDTFPFERYFVILCLIFGCLFVFLTPPFQAPDEVTHFLKSYSLSRLQLIPTVEDGTVMDTMDSEVLAFANSFAGLQYDANSKIDFSTISSWGNVYTTGSSDNAEQTTYITVNAYIVYYVPQALGMGFAHLLNMSVLWTLFMGRLFNLLFYILVLYYAIKTTPVAKNIFFLVALTPMAVFQAASLSYDVMVTSVCVLFTAHMLRLFFDPDWELSNGEFAWILVLSCLLIFMKTVYFPLVLLFLAIPREKFADSEERRKNFLEIVGTSVAVFIIVTLFRKFAYAGVVSSNSLTSDQITAALSDPNFFFQMIGNTFNAFGSEFSEEFIGKLGWLDTALPPWLITMYYGMLIASLFEFSPYECGLIERVQPEKLFRMVVSVILALFFFVVLLFAVFYFIMTLVTLQAAGSTVAQGIQGRYFIPVGFLGFSTIGVILNYRFNIGDWFYELMKKYNVIFIVLAQMVSIVTMYLRYYVS